MTAATKTAPTRPHTLFILGTPFCGSTLLGNALGAHPDAFFAGETDRLAAFGRHPEPVAGCRLCGGSHAKRRCPMWTKRFLGELAAAGEDVARYRMIRARVKAPVLVDGSKNVDWLNLLHDGGYREGVAAVLCARTPFAYAQSERGATGQTPFASAHGWRDVHVHILRSLAGRGLPTLVVRYEELAFDPERVLRKVADFAGLPFDLRMLRHWEHPAHPLGGNSSAYLRYRNFRIDAADPKEEWKPAYFADRPFGGWVEDKWIFELSDKEVCAILSVPTISDVAALLGYDLAWFLGERTRILAEAAGAADKTDGKAAA